MTERHTGIIGAIVQYHGIRPYERAERFAQPACWHQPVAKVVRCEQHDVEVAGQAPVLEAVIQQVKLRTELPFRESSSFVAFLADDDRYAELAGDQQRLVAVLLRASLRIDQDDAFGLSPIAAREHVEGDPALMQQLAQQDEKGGLARASDRDVADAHHRALQPMNEQAALIVEPVTNVDGRAEDGVERPQVRSCATTPLVTVTGCCDNRLSNAVRVRSVAPCCERSTSRARWPSRSRSS